MSLFLNPRVITLAALSSLAPFAIDTYLPAFHILSNDLLASPEAIQQSLTFYLLPYTVMLLFHGPISDGIGRIKTMQWGLALFFLASFGCAFSTSVESLWFFRALQGIGGGAGSVVARSNGKRLISRCRSAEGDGYCSNFIWHSSRHSSYDRRLTFRFSLAKYFYFLGFLCRSIDFYGFKNFT